jgi:hypothetical protein
MTIQGKLTGNDGTVLEGASIGLEVLDRRSARAPIERHAKSDGDGHFLLGGLVPGHYAVFGSHPGYLSRRIEVGEVNASTTFDFELFKACPRIVRVAPADPKTPIELSVQPQDGTSPERTFSGQSGMAIEVRDMAGLVSLYARTIGVRARTATRALDLCAASDEIELLLDRQGTGAIDVLVEDKSGKPIAQADVEISRASLVATTDEHGRASFEGLEPRRYYLSTGDTWSDAVVVGAGARESVTITVDHAVGDVTGNVVAGGAAIEGAVIRASCHDWAWNANLRNAPVVARSNADGSFSFTPKSAGMCLVRAEHQPEGSSEPTTLKAGGPPAELELHAFGSIAGRVIDRATGAPVAPYSLTVRSEGRGADADVRSVYVSDKSGRFAVEGLSPGMLSLYATADHAKGHAEIELRAGDTANVDIKVLEGGRVTGRVVAATGPIAGARVYLRSAGSGARSQDAVRAQVATDVDGRFSLPASAGDPLRVLASAEHFYPYGSRPFDLDPDGDTDLGDISLSPRGAAAEKEGGIGIQFAPDPNGVRVMRLLDDSPAREAGIDVGDVITQIDGVPAGRLPTVSWLIALRGPVGAPVILNIERGTQASFSVTVIRRAIGLDALPEDPLE